MNDSASLVSATGADEWNAAAEEAARWAERASLLIKRTDHILPAIESLEQTKVAASLALSATEAHGVKADTLRRSAAEAARNAARLARVVIDYLNQNEVKELESQARDWSKAIEIADRLGALAASAQSVPNPKKQWPLS